MQKNNQHSHREELKQEIASKENRKLRARREGDRSAWFGLGMFGLIGWSVVMPTLFGIAVGAWIDRRWPSQISWKITLLFLGVTIGFANAYRWMNQENSEK